MIISKTPYRVSLFGGSCDYESYYSQFGALLIGFAMNQYCYLLCRKTPPIFNYKTSVLYSKVEKVFDNKDIKHNGVRGVLEYLKVDIGLEIGHWADLVSQTGVGSSSTFIVGLLNAIYTLNGIYKNPRELAEEAIYVERILLKEAGGIQDQIWAAYGGIRSIEIKTDGQFFVKPLPISQEFIDEFKKHLVFCYTGVERDSFKIAASHDCVSMNKQAIHHIALDAYEAFQKEDIKKIGELLHQSWIYKKSISSLISNTEIDILYEKGMSLKAWGGKLLGTGGSGFLLFIVPPQYHEDFINNIGMKTIDINISQFGSQIIK